MGNFTKTEKTIFTMALVILALFSYFLYDDSLLFPRENNSNLQLVGDVSLSTNDVRRKNIENFSWSPVYKTDQVYQNDSIFTGDNSEAQIRLQDGTILRVEPNSLITLNFNNGEMSLDLRYGNLVGELKEGTTLKVTSGEEEFKLEGQKDQGNQNSTIKVRKASKGVMDLKLLGGTAKFIHKSAPPKVLNKDENLAVTATKVAPVTHHEIVLITQNNLSILRQSPTAPLKFEWDTQSKVAQFQLDISSDPSFETPVKSFKTAAKNFSMTEELPLGKYYWRVSVVDVIGITSSSESRNFSLVSLPIPEVVQPVHESFLTLELKKSGENLTYVVPLEWKAPPLLTNFEWDIAKSEDFSDIVSSGKSSSLGANSDSLPSGKYFFRVRGVTTTGSASAWSTITTFNLNLTEKEVRTPDRPILTTPEIKMTSAGPTTPPPVIAWKKVADALHYVVEISPTPDFTEKTQLKTTSHAVAWKKYTLGSHNFRVYAVGEDNTNSPASDIGTMTIEASSMTLNPIAPVRSVGGKVEPRRVPVSWSPSEFANSYMIQTTNTDTFPENGVITTQPLGNITLPAPGNFKVRIAALNASNQTVAFSNVQEAIYTHRPPLAAPKTLEPFNNASIFLQKDTEPFIWLDWAKSPNTNTYFVEISTTADFAKTIISTETKDTRFLIKTKVPLGQIYWRVRGRSNDNNELSEWSEPRNFILHHQKNDGVIR